MKIAIANDHHGVIRKKEIIKYLSSKGHEIIDLGAVSSEALLDYPEYAFKVVNAIKNNEAEYGILLCRTGIGMSIAANRFKGIRCAKVDSISDIKLARNDNNANIISFSENMKLYKVKDILDIYLTTPFLGERHLRRIEKLDNYDN